MDAADFQKQFNVPRGTMERFERYAALIAEWQARMNLVGPATVSDIWSRHFADSAQLSAVIPPGKWWLDIGAGGGFPGMVLAAMDWGRFVLIDSIAKKCRFLETLRLDLGLAETVSVVCARVEAVPTLGVDIATARAAAQLPTLLDWSLRHLKPGGLCVFPKGRRWASEVDDATGSFQFDLETFPSMTDRDARILVIRNLKRR